MWNYEKPFLLFFWVIENHPTTGSRRHKWRLVETYLPRAAGESCNEDEKFRTTSGKTVPFLIRKGRERYKGELRNRTVEDAVVVKQEHGDFTETRTAKQRIARTKWAGHQSARLCDVIIPCPDNLSFKKRKSRVCLIICFENGVFTDTNVRNISKVIRSAINVGYTDTSFTNEDWITYLYWSSFEPF